MERLTIMTASLLHDLVCHPGDWEDARPWLRPLLAGRGPDRTDDRPPVEEQAKKKWLAPLKAAVLIFPKHTESEIHRVNRDKRVRSTTQSSGV